MLGRVLKNRYKLIDERGRGSMATVYIGRDLENNRMYAVKALSSEAAADAELAERFQREFELLSRLSGPHIVSPVDFGEDRGALFIVMDYVDGHNLKHRILTGGALPIPSAVDVIEQAAAAITLAANQGIIHRDIKPQNLLIGVDNVVRLTDFGLARSHESRDITVTGFFVGTPFYVAPEQVENSHRADTRADLYSLGCVFFESLTAHVPYDGEHAWDVVMQHLNAPVPSVRQWRGDLPEAYEAFFEKALAKDPTARFQTPADFVAAVEELPQSVSAAPQTQSASATGAADVAVARLGNLRATNGQEFALTAPDLIIGRSDPARGHVPDIDLLALDPSQTVSRRHARIAYRDGHAYLEDLNAFNRTKVNGEELAPHQEVALHSGDRLRLGSVELTYEAHSR
jgi:serine/threonine-protein kinase